MKVTKSATILFILIHITSCYNCASSYRKFLKKEIIYDEIKFFYKDEKEHMTPTSILSNNSEELHLVGMEDLLKNANVGDTLKKDSNSLAFYLIKKDAILIFNPKCNGTYIYY